MAEIATLTTRHGTLYRHDGTDILAEDDGLWVTLTVMDSQSLLLVDKDEWPAFVQMVNMIDLERMRKNNGPV
jgi:hypothetical protein